MSKKSYFEGLPEACGVPHEVAVHAGKWEGALFDIEKGNPNSIFRRLPRQSIAARFKPAFAAWEAFADPKELAYAKRLTYFLAASHNYNVKGIGVKKLLQAEAILLKAQEHEHPKIAALLTVDQAAAQGEWD